MINKVHETLVKNGMLRQGDHVLVAVSGGADSVALLHCLRGLAQRWDLRLTLAHLNHRLRGPESEEDEAFVRNLGDKLGIRVVSERWERPAKGNVEESARRARYGFLRRSARAEGATKIALGHTRDDQAETVLLRLLRGSGFLGLGGIYPVVDDLLIRPLIEVTRREIEKYLLHRGIPWRSDSSNDDLHFLRNRVRHQLLPLLRDRYSLGIEGVLVREAGLARDISGFLDRLSTSSYERVRRDAPGGVALDVHELLDLDPVLQGAIARRAIQEFRGTLRSVSSAHVKAVLDLARGHRSGRYLSLPGAVVSRQFDRIVMAGPEAGARIAKSRELPVPGTCDIPEIGITVEARIEDSARVGRNYPDRKTGAIVAAEALPPALLVRGRRPGDRYGGAGHTKLKKVLIEARIPARERDGVPVIVAGDTVVWVPGCAPATPFAPGKAPSPVVVLTLNGVRS